jgi:hypothetical protein
LSDVPILRSMGLHGAQVIFLREIARRGGEMTFAWPNAREDVRGMVADLMQKQLVKYVEYVTSANQASGPTFLLLTDPGRRAVAQLEEADRKRIDVKSDAPEIKVTA